MVFMIVFWVLVIIGLVFLIDWLVLTSSSAKTDNYSGLRAFESFKEPYAIGEINKAEFEPNKKEIN